MVKLLTFAIFCSALMIFESLLTRIYAIVIGPPLLYTLALFIGLVLFFSLSNYIFLRFSKKKNDPAQPSVDPKGLFIPILSIQLVLVLLLGIISIQLLLYGSYQTIVLSSVIFLSHIAGFGYLAFISYQFIRWFSLNKKYVLVTYGIGFSLLAISITFSLVYLTLEISLYDPVLRLRNINSQLRDDLSPTTQMVSIGIWYNYVSGSSFVLIWIPTVFLLRTYFLKISKIKYWIMVAIPLVFYFFPFIANELGLFENLRLQYGNTFDFYYTIFFSPYKQIGGLLFGLVFWITSRRVKQENLQTLLQNASIGLILIFGSTVLYGLDAIIVPPFGVVTISYMGLASYLLSTGIFYTARNIAKDRVLRKEFYRNAMTQLDLLRAIGVSQMEKELIQKYKAIDKRTRSLEKHSPFEKDEVKEALHGLVDDLDKEKAREILHDVLTEVYSKSKPKNNS